MRSWHQPVPNPWRHYREAQRAANKAIRAGTPASDWMPAYSAMLNAWACMSAKEQAKARGTRRLRDRKCLVYRALHTGRTA